MPKPVKKARKASKSAKRPSRAASAKAPAKSPNWPALTVELRPLAELTPYARNARTHSPEQVDQIAASIVEFGWTMPVLVDESGTIIAGHGRVLAAEKLGIREVPVSVATGWSEQQVRAYGIADNQLALGAGWNDDLLRSELATLHAEEFDLGLIGFADADLARLLAAPPPGGDGGEPYSRSIVAPIYEPSGETPAVTDLYDVTKARELKKAINAAELPPELRAFLWSAAERHTVFNFAKVADYYANSMPEVQRLMEASGLVIVDFKQAIESGFVKLTSALGDLVARDYQE